MIGFDKQLVSKVLIFEDAAVAQGQLKAFCSEHGLIGLKQANQSAMKMLAANIDLGAVLISEGSTDIVAGIANGFELARRVHQLRRELPIFIRREGRADLDDLAPEQRAGIAGAYDIERPETLKLLLDQYLADTEYPISLIRRIEEVTHSSLTALFRDIEVSNELPYLVKDKLTYGDILSLLPVESPWFSGYMMVQSEEQPMIELIKAGRTAIDGRAVDFRDVMGMLSEITNLAWGGLRTRLLALHPPTVDDSTRISVPITVNQYKEYISFGTDRSQLCFKYTLRDVHGQLAPVTLFQKFIFNIRWSPEEYLQADENKVEDLVESGCLELF
ncbi:response regulator [Pseudomonas sp. J452]|uniref:response regulator n=1 Tax=Pseudomonas sp. J452 TaxID=2898441 RepID=UPI0021ADB945|nr:response regulator [Pseudomonas sp. J452]UUY10034.1 response regulator [Pseudomonas sp. J452]